MKHIPQFHFEQDMFDKTTQTIYLCGKTTRPDKTKFDCICLKSDHTGKVLQFTICATPPYPDGRIYYYNTEVNAYATL